ncbi:uncharacterized protein [Aegilops tauschii subsp. strangulata]|uniref:uncharacterized protein n=1 Tax=Aegilops tauschii subsp. strangulata TaxID=200361 RepID=UPI003CC8BDBD
MPLTQLLTKKGFEWNEKAQDAFVMLKKAMVSTPVVALPDCARPFMIETDACDTGVGARAPFEIVTDHKSLCALSDQQLATELQRKAMAKLVGLQLTFRYKRGTDNGAADALSRVGHLMALDVLSLCQPQWLQEVANSYVTDPDAQELLAKLTVIDTDDQGRTLQQGVIRQRGRL